MHPEELDALLLQPAPFNKAGVSKEADMNPSDKKDFKAFVRDVIQSHVPLADYSKVSDKHLIELNAWCRIVECQCVAMLLYRGTNLNLGVDENALKAMQYASDLTPSALAGLYDADGDREVVELLLHDKIEWVLIRREARRRLSNRPVGRMFLRLELDPKNTEPFEKIMQIDRIKRSDRPWEEDVGDTKQKSWRKGLELYRESGEAILKDGISIQLYRNFSVNMHPPEREYWEWLTSMWSPSTSEVLLRVFPALSGDAELLPQRVRDYRREEWRTAKRREKKREDWAEPGQRTYQDSVVSDKVFMVLKEAKKHWGDKAFKAFYYLFKGETEEKAAAMAGITPRTLRNYISTLRKDFFIKD